MGVEKKGKMSSSCGLSTAVSCLEGQASVAVGCEDLLDGVDVGSGSQVEAEVEAGAGLHDGAG